MMFHYEEAEVEKRRRTRELDADDVDHETALRQVLTEQSSAPLLLELPHKGRHGTLLSLWWNNSEKAKTTMMRALHAHQ